MSIFKKANNRGFTLIELLVVIAIIGVLATLILLQLGTARAKARDAKRIADVNQLRTAIELYFDDFGGSYPGAALCPSTVGASCTAMGAPAPLWDGNDLTSYMSAKVLPADPLNGQQYSYAWGPVGDVRHYQYHIYTDLERRNVPALAGDVDMDSTGFGGVAVDINDPADEVCADNVAADCMYDLGQL